MEKTYSFGEAAGILGTDTETLAALTSDHLDDLTVGVHGEDRITVTGMDVLARQLCDPWRDDPEVAEY